MKVTNDELSQTEVRDDRGEPLVVYHGTPQPLACFSDDYLQSLGFHFGDPAQANHFAGNGAGACIFPVYLLIRNLIDIRPSDSGWLQPQATAITLSVSGLLSHAEAVDIVGSDNLSLAEYRQIEPQTIRQERNRRIIAALQAKGFDGIVYSNRQEPGDGVPRDAYLVFHANQIVSAITLVRLSTESPSQVMQRVARA